jgi:tetratricopeptide (TPR) repeat protein
VLLELGEKALAIAAFQGALRSYEEYADAHYHLARTLDELGQGDEAAEHWARFAELAPDSPWADEARQRLQ